MRTHAYADSLCNHATLKAHRSTIAKFGHSIGFPHCLITPGESHVKVSLLSSDKQNRSPAAKRHPNISCFNNPALPATFLCNFSASESKCENSDGKCHQSITKRIMPASVVSDSYATIHNNNNNNHMIAALR